MEKSNCQIGGSAVHRECYPSVVEREAHHPTRKRQQTLGVWRLVRGERSQSGGKLKKLRRRRERERVLCSCLSRRVDGLLPSSSRDGRQETLSFPLAFSHHRSSAVRVGCVCVCVGADRHNTHEGRGLLSRPSHSNSKKALTKGHCLN